MTGPQTTVMVVDDSAVIRGMITRFLEKSPDIKVTASAQNGQIAVDLYEKNPADVVILDVEMPVMDGITALTHIMRKHPRARVIMCSTLTHQNADITLRAMAIGAADYIAKPTSTSEINSSNDFQQNLTRMVLSLGQRLSRSKTGPQTPTGIATPRTTAIVLRPEPPLGWRPRILAIGASTGGPQALFAFLKPLAGMARTPIVVTQHMPPTFTSLLAKHITMHTSLPAVEIDDNTPLEDGRVHVARGGMHMVAQKALGRTVLRLDDGPPENFCKPAVDPMLRSLIPIYGNGILSVILTGMGADGSKGCEQVVEAGGYVAAQDQASAVVWGMPGAAAARGLCCKLDTPENLGAWVRQKVQ